MSIQLAGGKIIIKVPADFNMGYIKGYCEAEAKFDKFLDNLFFLWSVRFWQNPFYCSNFASFWTNCVEKSNKLHGDAGEL